MLDDLTGKVALETGASRGIGKAVAVALAKAGADVAVDYRSREADAGQTCAEIERLGRRAAAIRADAASKAGILGLTHSYAKLLAREGITVDAIAPALIETEMVTSNPKARADLIPAGRFGSVEEIADVVVMLAPQRIHHGPNDQRQRRLVHEQSEAGAEKSTLGSGGRNQYETAVPGNLPTARPASGVAQSVAAPSS
ncbi:MAG: SDR family NAD(P)-dependent oxidoreductase [Pirellulales bacterium]|nr:SDR family NAD(P)-dependent oxidoreductase [Pirellulales bacterium]